MPPSLPQNMKHVVTGLIVKVEVTIYNEAGQVAGRLIDDSRQDKAVVFEAVEAYIPETVLEWVRKNIKMGVE